MSGNCSRHRVYGDKAADVLDDGSLGVMNHNSSGPYYSLFDKEILITPFCMMVKKFIFVILHTLIDGKFMSKMHQRSINL